MSTTQFRVVVGSDAAGAALADILLDDLRADSRIASVRAIGHDDRDLYPEVAITAAEMVASGEADRAVLVCGTGLGVAISANKVAGIRAVTAHDSYSVERSVRSNDAQVLCLGQRVVGVELARRLVREWFDYSFDRTSPSAEKVEAVARYERRATTSLSTTTRLTGRES
jgi:ribose 5-phosphate isomerase B